MEFLRAALASALPPVSSDNASEASTSASTSTSTSAVSTPSDELSGPALSSAPSSSSSLSKQGAPQAAESTPVSDGEAEKERLALAASPYFTRLVKRGTHKPHRIREIACRAAKGTRPPTEPEPYECCNSSCGIDCVVTMWWEEEKTWRDVHGDEWKALKEQYAAEDEERRREEEEAEALGGPALTIEAC